MKTWLDQRCVEAAKDLSHEAKLMVPVGRADGCSLT